MQIATTVNEVRDTVRAWKRQGFTVGLVPTMGYLHEGHASLVRRAASMCDRVVASVFVNPTQFSPNEDLAAYPRDFERDTNAASFFIRNPRNSTRPTLIPGSYRACRARTCAA